MEVQKLESGKLIIICEGNDNKHGGLFTVDLDLDSTPDQEDFEKLHDDSLLQFAFSQCGRMLGILGTSTIHIWSLPNLQLISRMSHDFKGALIEKDGQNHNTPKNVTHPSFPRCKLIMTSEQMLFATEKGWSYLALKSNLITTTV